MVVAALTLILQKAGVRVGVMKAVETGCRPRPDGSLGARDAEFLKTVSGSEDPEALVCPERYRAPLAPWTAATREGKRVSVARIRNAYGRLARRHSLVFVEGAGGVAVPLSKNYSFSELARDLSLSAIVVARPMLGTINHTVLTVERLRERKVPVIGVVFCKTNPGRNALAADSSARVIKSLTGVPFMGTLGFMRTKSRTALLRAGASLNLPRFLQPPPTPRKEAK